MTRAVATPAHVRARGRLRVPEIVRSEPGVFVSALVWLLFLANFTVLALPGGDATVQYRFVQQMFGDASHAVGYYFGFALLEAPFYGFGKLLEQVGVHDLGGHPIEPALIALAIGLLVLPAGALLAWLLRQLRLPAPGAVLLASAFGTPVFFYAVFQPGKNHVPDAVLFSVVVWLTFLYFRREQPARYLAPALGAVLGFSATVRYFSGAEIVPLVAALLVLRRWRHAAEVAGAAASVFWLLFLIPRSFGVPVFTGGYTTDNIIVFAPLNPLRMLFTDHRGLFVWSPVTALAAMGVVRLILRRPEHRRFLLVAIAMGLAIIASYSLIPFWDGTWSFSQRFYTPLFPLVAIGLAGLVEPRPRPVQALATLGVAWSLFLCFNLTTIGGPQYNSNVAGGASDLALVPARTHTSAGAYLWGIYHRSRLIEPVVPWPFH